MGFVVYEGCARFSELSTSDRLCPVATSLVIEHFPECWARVLASVGFVKNIILLKIFFKKLFSKKIIIFFGI